MADNKLKPPVGGSSEDILAATKQKKALEEKMKELSEKIRKEEDKFKPSNDALIDLRSQRKELREAARLIDANTPAARTPGLEYYRERGQDAPRYDDWKAVLKKGGVVKKYAKGGAVKSSASKRADGCAKRGKTRGKMV